MAKKTEVLGLIAAKMQDIRKNYVTIPSRPTTPESDPRYFFLVDLETSIKADDQGAAYNKVQSGKRQSIARFLMDTFSAVEALHVIWASVLK